ncbi:hypothetical protein THASP1DRAFT_27700 [Thamnocephalis sphaerospora]|uniref:Mitochondrial zinc maintenance protein 1, mitochondrial n=1 Tax=Thamnocephalis sphaerospora TaxID=78915 RepID=A0A4P9XW37_9FUNG|nr:hypothetical protein THASP1DRAFT_27700 [Thamnocephalis sphaerospora]|eukprot:RKP10516.1 hypothetical protein THASP1DRAFT_27700 [Thamnocephalis sphaerospora]
MNRTRALGVYRQLLRIQHQRFQGDDIIVKAARDRTRDEFVKLRNETDPEKIEAALTHGREVALLLERNVAQASRVDSQPGVYKLNITQQHEINKNPAVKISDLRKNKQTSCCGGSSK